MLHRWVKTELKNSLWYHTQEDGYSCRGIPLDKNPTVFYVDIIPINSAAVKLLEYAHLGRITMYCDSQAALMVLDSTKVMTGTVLTTIMNLEVLAQKQVAKLFWIKAHIGRIVS
jgi:hypothetical protein